MTGYRVLAINGGGVRGLIPAKMLDKLSKKAGKPISELFDCIVGTSIGGIIATALTVPDENGKPKYTTDDVVNLIKNEATTIFPRNVVGNMPFIGPVANVFYPKYSRDGIDGLLERKLGNVTLSETIIPIITVSYSLDSDGPRVWSSDLAIQNPTKNNHKLKDAAGATSAAPTYFPPKITITENGDILHDIDGGIYANSPTILGMGLVNKATTVRWDKVVIVSLGTGRFEDNPGNPITPASDENASWLSTIVNNLSMIPTLPGAGITSAITSCLTASFYTTGGVAAPICFLSALTGVAFEIYNAKSGYGQLGWVISHGLIDSMMKGSEVADGIASAMLFKAIRINPNFDKEFSALDNADPIHLSRFEKAIDRFVEQADAANIWKNMVECLEDKYADSYTCNLLRVETLIFSEAYKTALIGELAEEIIGTLFYNTTEMTT